MCIFSQIFHFFLMCLARKTRPFFTPFFGKLFCRVFASPILGVGVTPCCNEKALGVHFFADFSRFLCIFARWRFPNSWPHVFSSGSGFGGSSLVCLFGIQGLGSGLGFGVWGWGGEM